MNSDTPLLAAGSFIVLECFGVKGQVKVKDVFNHSITYRGSLAKMGFDCHVLGITKEIRLQLGITFGDNVNVELMQDTETRQVEIPNDVQKYLDSNPEKQRFFINFHSLTVMNI